MTISAQYWPYLMAVLYLVGALLSAGAGLWIARFGDRERPDRVALLAACTAMTVWCAATITLPPDHAGTELALTARNLALIMLIFRLFATDGRDASLKPIRPVVIALALVELFQPVLLFINIQVATFPELVQLTFEIGAMLNMLVAIGALVLLHNLYAGATASSRRMIRWSALGLAVIFGYDLNFYTFAWLGGQYPATLFMLRGAVVGAMALLLALGANAVNAGLQFRPSRAVTFQTLSLIVIGSYLVVMTMVTRSLSLFGGDFARLGQMIVLVLAVAVAVLWLPSGRFRAWLRVTVSKHLFQHRYDYREEWLRFTRTIGRGTAHDASLHERAVKAIADITDSPAGLYQASFDDHRCREGWREMG